MRTFVIIAGGLLLLGASVLVARWTGGGAHTMSIVAKSFIVVWLAIALLNLWMGVARAGYSAGEEFPIFLVIFLVPACAAAFVAWRFA
jgi:hypothetical protein